MFVEGNDYKVIKDGSLFGTIIGDEFIRSLDNKLIYRIDDQEIWTAGLNASCIGVMDGLTGKDHSGQTLFVLELD